MTAIFYIIIRVVLVAAILVGMIVILMGINHFAGAGDDETIEETEKLREEVHKSDKVISPHSLFQKFLVHRKEV